eukprot:768127-Hanusia_phi.AAC.4
MLRYRLWSEVRMRLCEVLDPCPRISHPRPRLQSRSLVLLSFLLVCLSLLPRPIALLPFLPLSSSLLLLAHERGDPGTNAVFGEEVHFDLVDADDLVQGHAER